MLPDGDVELHLLGEEGLEEYRLEERCREILPVGDVDDLAVLTPSEGRKLPNATSSWA